MELTHPTTVVLPYFPYSRQSKKKSHRGAITARMLANLLEVSGVNHVITIDLHASQMQGFFRCPVDNLVAEPLIASWIKAHVPGWKNAVVVSKNPGGTKRVTSLADALKLGFGIIMTDRARPNSGPTSLNASTTFQRLNSSGFPPNPHDGSLELESIKLGPSIAKTTGYSREQVGDTTPKPGTSPQDSMANRDMAILNLSQDKRLAGLNIRNHTTSSVVGETPSSSHAASANEGAAPAANDPDRRSREIITGRLVHGHIVDDNAPSPSPSAVSSRTNGIRWQDSDEEIPDNMLSSVFSTTSSIHQGPGNGLGGSGDAVGGSDDEEEKLLDPALESTVTLVGNVKDRVVIIVDDIIDRSASWIAAAETVVKRGEATSVYCMATHGLFGGDCLREMEECECIHKVVVTNSFPIPALKAQESRKLEVLDVSGLLSEAIRRNHHGESIHQLFVHHE